MQIHKQLLMNGETAKLVTDQIRLELNTPGRALLTVTDTTPERGQLVELNAQLDSQALRRVFYGYVEAVTEIKTGVYQVLARELTAALNRRIPLNLRHCLPGDVLTAISDLTGLTFVLPDQPWTQQTIARFQPIGGGYMALDSLLTLWQVSQGIWHQQPDGRVYVGEWAYSVPGQRSITLPANLFQDNSQIGGTLPLVPRLRPGVVIQQLAVPWLITRVEITGTWMRLNWVPVQNVWQDDLRRVH